MWLISIPTDRSSQISNNGMSFTHLIIKTHILWDDWKTNASAMCITRFFGHNTLNNTIIPYWFKAHILRWLNSKNVSAICLPRIVGHNTLNNTIIHLLVHSCRHSVILSFTHSLNVMQIADSLTFSIPSLIYSVTRHTHRYVGCHWASTMTFDKFVAYLAEILSNICKQQIKSSDPALSAWLNTCVSNRSWSTTDCHIEWIKSILPECFDDMFKCNSQFIKSPSPSSLWRNGTKARTELH